jgi:thiamine-phosphate pyrophosphorylase
MRLEAPIVCLVTDRRRAVGDAGSIHAVTARLTALAREAAAACVDIIQVRERDLETRALVDLVGAIIEATRGSSTRVVVNDRLDVGLVCGAAGVHLRSDSVAAATVRRHAPPGFLIGRSVHDPDEARLQVSGADYLIAGTVFPSASKPMSDRMLGLEGLAAVVRAVSVPVCAIGGIDQARVAQVGATGAAGVAGIGLFLQSAMPMKDLMATIRAQFEAGARLVRTSGDPAIRDR